MAKITLTFIVTLFTCLRLASAGLHKRHRDLAGRALLHEHAHIARNALQGALDPIPVKPRTASGIGKRDGGSAAEYTLLGCFSELSTDGIDLLVNTVPWNMTTIQTCVESCYTSASSPYPYAGVIRGNTCKCDNAIPASATQVDQSNCRSQCASGDEQWCGGLSAYQVYYSPSATPVTTTTTDVPTTGTISEVSPAPDTSTDASTTDSSTEPSTPPGTSPAPSTNTESASPAPTSTTPGIPSTVVVPSGISYNYVGCYEDTPDIISRVLRGPGSVSSSMTPTECASHCFGEGYPYAGVESDQCFCGATLFASSNSDQCTQACPGDGTLACGAPLRIGIYAISDTASLGSLQPLPTSSTGEWSSIGCYIDDTSAPVMEFIVPTIPTTSLSVDACTEACKGLGHSFAGLEFGSQCFCSNNAPTLQADAHDCDMPCPVGGGSCGAGLRLDVYKQNI